MTLVNDSLIQLRPSILRFYSVKKLLFLHLITSKTSKNPFHNLDILGHTQSSLINNLLIKKTFSLFKHGELHWLSKSEYILREICDRMGFVLTSLIIRKFLNKLSKIHHVLSCLLIVFVWRKKHLKFFALFYLIGIYDRHL